MAKLSLASLQNELSRRLSGLIPTSDTTTLNASLDRAVRFIDSLCSYTFMQGYATGNLSATTILPMPADINLQKEMKVYVNNLRLNYVPYSELRAYQGFTTLTPMAFAYDSTASTFQKVTATANGANNGVAITGTTSAPALITSITAYVNSAFTTGTMSIGTTTDATLFDTAIPVTATGDVALSLSSVPYAFTAAFTPRVTLAITGTGSVDVFYHYSQVGTSASFILNMSTTAPYYMYYTKRMTLPSTGNYVEIPDHWYEIMLDVAEFQQKEIYRMVFSEEAKANTIERLKQFVREYNATQEANVNINDEMIRKGA